MSKSAASQETPVGTDTKGDDFRDSEAESQLGENEQHHTRTTGPLLTPWLSGHLQQAADAKRQIGVVSATFLVVNRVIGTGIFATPGAILALSGSVGLSLFIWVAGIIITAAGMAVYLEFGTAIPKNGGEKNYLEYVFRKPKFLTTGLYTGYIVLLGWASSNSVIFGMLFPTSS